MTSLNYRAFVTEGIFLRNLIQKKRQFWGSFIAFDFMKSNTVEFVVKSVLNTLKNSVALMYQSQEHSPKTDIYHHTILNVPT